MTVAASSLSGVSAAVFEAVRTGDVRPLNDNVKSVEDLEPRDENGQTPLHVAATIGEAAIGAYLVELGADPNVQDPRGDTPLHLAARHRHRLVASMLLWGGAKTELTNNLKNTPLHDAVLADNRDVAWLIVENGGDRSAKTPNAEGLTPLDIARARGNAEVIEVLESA